MPAPFPPAASSLQSPLVSSPETLPATLGGSPGASSSHFKERKTEVSVSGLELWLSA